MLRGLYERGYAREDVVALFHFLDWLMRLPVKLEQQLWRELQAEEEARKMQLAMNSETQIVARCQWMRLGLFP